MKKIIFLFMTVLALAACSNEEANKEISDSNENVEWDLIPMVYIDDNLYLLSNEKSTTTK